MLDAPPELLAGHAHLGGVLDPELVLRLAVADHSQPGEVGRALLADRRVDGQQRERDRRDVPVLEVVGVEVDALVVQAESGGNYQAVSPNGVYMGAFQFSQSSWNEAAQLAGLPGLIGVPPNDASKADQDTLAIALYDADGEQPWYDPCSS